MKLFKILSAVVLPILALSCLNGQQLPFFAQFESFGYLSNPALTSPSISKENQRAMSVSALHRERWKGFEDAPTTTAIASQVYLPDQHIILGGTIMNDKFGPMQQTQIQLQYAYQMQFDRWAKHTLSFGIGAVLTNYKWDPTSFLLENPSDPIIANNSVSFIRPNANLGLWYKNQFKNGFGRELTLYTGLSTEQLIEQLLNIESSTGLLAGMERQRHYHGIIGLRIYQLDNKNDYLEAFTQISKVFYAPTQIFSGFNITFANGRFIIGAATTNDFQFRFKAQMEVMDGISINYIINNHLSPDLSKQAGMTHQLSINYIYFM